MYVLSINLIFMYIFECLSGKAKHENVDTVQWYIDNLDIYLDKHTYTLAYTKLHKQKHNLLTYTQI